jgi:predicted O-methyltransferase YrrM
MYVYVTVMSTLSNISAYLKYFVSAKSAHGIHSPFVYKFVTELLESNNEGYYQFKELDKVRADLLNNNTVIEIEDFGAGSKKFGNTKRKISAIAKHGISKKKFSELYFKLVNFTNSQFIIELGTSLGLNTLYLAKANSKSVVYSIEGSKELTKFAEELFQQQNAKVFLINDKFDHGLPLLLNEIPQVDFLYVDGNHSYDATIRYFKMGLPKKHNNSVFVFDDINWSEGMQKAWEEIKAHPEVTLSIDLFYAGIIFFRKEQQQKEHFILRY